ncbi:hypothetical protein ACFYST_31610 [Kitasatospora sp. NPDC004614]|uniref:hypothetical protein n=1 Tax=unclassified Kitasatospora TaxID=2633591 RepID=UPI00368BF3E1
MTAVLPALAAFAVRQRLLLVPVGVLTVVLHHHAWHQQQGPEFGWGWFPALGESSCVLFLGVALPWMVHLLPALSRAEQN